MKPSNNLHIDTLNDNWCDKDLIILHACFQLLTDCVEKENLLNCHIDWNVDENSIKAKIEIENLYKWWKQRKILENELEQNQYEQDNVMLKKLIDYRKYLWT